MKEIIKKIKKIRIFNCVCGCTFRSDEYVLDSKHAIDSCPECGISIEQ